MRATVFRDPALAKHAGRFVWLSIDSEKAENAAFLARFPTEVSPTLLVIDASRERAVLSWPGSATAAQLEKLFDDGERAAREASDEAAAAAEAALARADRLSGARKFAEAAAAYRDALAAGGPTWPRRPRAVESLVYALQAAHDRPGCARAARELAPGLPVGPSRANASVTGLTCALAARDEATRALEALVGESLAVPGLLADDRSGLYETLIEACDQRGDAAGAKKLAGDWLHFLEAEAARAQTPEARAAFDAHRVGAALELGDPARVVPALEASARDFPADYNPPARLALVYRAMGRLDQAQAASEQALARVQGPRRLRVLEVLAEIQMARGDHAGARRTIDEALGYAASLPPVLRDRAGTTRELDRFRTLAAKLAL